MEKRIIIIDGNSLINRAYYAMQRPMITREGIYTQGIFGFLNMLLKMFDDYDPDYMAVAWDRKAPTFRHLEYDEYKAGRKKMPPELAMELPLIKEILTAMHIANLEIDGFEADDIIGTVARIAEEEGLAPLIITGDKDALQLATDKTKVLITRKGISEFDLYNREKMLERYGLTPEQFIDLKGLMGDQSDNIPGIPGVGEKTGIKLLKQFGSVAELLAHTDQISAKGLREKVETNAQLAVMSRRLAEINTHVPLEIHIDDYRVQDPDYEKLVELYTKLELNTFLKRLRASGVQEAEAEEIVDDTEYEMILISGESELARLEEIPDGSDVVLRVFGNRDHVEKPVLDGIALLWKTSCFYIDMASVSAEKILSKIQKLKLTGHELGPDVYMLLSAGAAQCNVAFDTAVAEYALDSARSSYALPLLTQEYLHREIPSEKDFLEQSGQVDLLGQSTGAFSEYGLTWCRTVKQIAAMQRSRLKEEGAEQLCREIEFPLIEVLASMEVEGIAVSRSMLQETGKELVEKISALEQEIYTLAGESFNINSPQQLGTILFEKLGLPAGKKTKRGYSTSADILDKLKDDYPIVAKVLEYRTLSKLNSTYVQGLSPLIGSDGKIHAHFQQTVAATGRLSCTEPNLQNIPVRLENGRLLRKAFIADEDCILTGADYSQIELRILAHLSGDENLISAFNNGDDIHRMTASRVFGIDYDKVTSLDRSRAKAVNFGVIYGMSGFGLSEELHISRKQADSYIRDYFAKHPAVKAYMDGQIEYAKKNGYTETMFGRRRYIREITASNFMTRQLGERLAMNSPIQGTAADIIKIAMIRVFRELRERNLKSRLILQIHDELIIQTASGEEDLINELLVRNMEEAASLKVALLCDRNTGKSWYDLKG